MNGIFLRKKECRKERKNIKIYPRNKKGNIERKNGELCLKTGLNEKRKEKKRLKKCN